MACLRLRFTSKCIKLLLMCAAIVKTYGVIIVPSPGTLFFFCIHNCMHVHEQGLHQSTYIPFQVE